jgi:hypothetical protein
MEDCRPWDYRRGDSDPGTDDIVRQGHKWIQGTGIIGNRETGF